MNLFSTGLVVGDLPRTVTQVFTAKVFRLSTEIQLQLTK